MSPAHSEAMTPNTFPPLSDVPVWDALEQGVRDWAVARFLIHSDGKPAKATTKGQIAKLKEEIAEAHAALEQLAKAPTDTERQIAAALELGDCLVVLSLLAAMRGRLMPECLVPTPLIAINAKSDMAWATAQEWEQVETWLDRLEESIYGPSFEDEWAVLGVLCRCVEGIAHRAIARTARECLSLALSKIMSRTGRMVDGQFVKDEVVECN